MIDKRTVMIGAVGGMVIGGALPYLWGDFDPLSLTGIGLATIGGLVGIWLVAWLDKRFGL